MHREKFYIDTRVLKTQRALKDAVLELLKSHVYDDVDVTMIVHKAGVTRSTFYNHFSDKNALLDELITGKMQELEAAYRAPFITTRPFILSRLPASEVELFDNILKNADYYSTIFNSNLSALIERRMVDSFKKINLEEINVKDDFVRSDLIAGYLAYGTVGLITEWVREGCKYEAKFMNAQVLELMKIAPCKTFHIKLSRKDGSKGR